MKDEKDGKRGRDKENNWDKEKYSWKKTNKQITHNKEMQMEPFFQGYSTAATERKKEKTYYYHYFLHPKPNLYCKESNWWLWEAIPVNSQIMFYSCPL